MTLKANADHSRATHARTTHRSYSPCVRVCTDRQIYRFSLQRVPPIANHNFLATKKPKNKNGDCIFVTIAMAAQLAPTPAPLRATFLATLGQLPYSCNDTEANPPQ
jgi:hypothetical protein